MRKYLRVARELWERDGNIKDSFEERLIMLSSLPIFGVIYAFKILTFPYWIYKYLKEVK